MALPIDTNTMNWYAGPAYVDNTPDWEDPVATNRAVTKSSKAAPRDTCDPHFPNPPQKFSSALKASNQSHLSIRNRFNSIYEDSAFVDRVSQEEPYLPAIANDRCGLWYIRPERIVQEVRSVYFKSTDGHVGQWDFSTRRLNLDILHLIGVEKGWAKLRTKA